MNIRIFPVLYGLVLCLQFGCSLDSFVKAQDPEEESELSRSHMRSLQGAISLFNSARGDLQDAVSVTALEVGLFTDELTIRPDNHSDFASLSSLRVTVDTRHQQQSSGGITLDGILFRAYDQTQLARVSAAQSRYLFRELADPSLAYAISASYAVEGYAILLMAENMCSGIPLSESPFEGKGTYSKALRTDEVFRIAVSKFDSAIQLNHDSVRFHTLAKIGKGRALMGLGEYQRAAEAVKDVQPTEIFELRYSDVHTPSIPPPQASTAKPFDAFWTWVPTSASIANVTRSVEVINNEGMNGMTWYSNASAVDPRLPVTTAVNSAGVRYFPAVVRQEKFVKGGVRFKLAKWAEAKLIEAEYLLSTNDAGWIDALNEARRSVGLPDTTSPADMDDKVDLLFRERAFWFYGEGVRLADFRRLVRQYNRSPFMVYPIGGYTRHSGYAHYGDVLVYIPEEDKSVNHMYDGCIHHNP